MKSKKIIAASAAVLSLGLLAAPAATAYADPPGNHGVVVRIDKDAWKQAKADLKAALTAARDQFHADIKAAIATFRTDTADDRAALKAVLLDEASTPDQIRAAKDAYLVATAEARATRKAAFVAAKATWKEAREAAWAAFRAAVHP